MVPVPLGSHPFFFLFFFPLFFFSSPQFLPTFPLVFFLPKGVPQNKGGWGEQPSLDPAVSLLQGMCGRALCASASSSRVCYVMGDPAKKKKKKENQQREK